MNDLQVKKVDFFGDTLVAAQDKHGQIWAGVNFICAGIGLSEKQKDRQVSNIQSDKVLKLGACKLSLKFEGQARECLCVKLDFVPLWLAKINITPGMEESNPEAVDKLVNYQLQAKDVLAAAFLNKTAKGSGAESRASEEAKLLNARARVSKQWMDLAKFVNSPDYQQICASYAGNVLAGFEVIPPPEAKEKHYTATEVGKLLGVSSQKIGIISNQLHLKTVEYGKWYHDKARNCAKEVDSFRYNEHGVQKLREYIEGTLEEA